MSKKRTQCNTEKNTCNQMTFMCLFMCTIIVPTPCLKVLHIDSMNKP